MRGGFFIGLDALRTQLENPGDSEPQNSGHGRIVHVLQS